MPGCQPAGVEWHRVLATDLCESVKVITIWNLSVWCHGCGQYRTVRVADSVARNVELAEQWEQDVLAELHAPPEPGPNWSLPD